MELQNKSELLDRYKTDKLRGPVLTIRTSGSTSKPLYICLNEYDVKHITDVGARCFLNAGLQRGMTVINTMNSSCWAGGTLDSISLAKTGANLINFSVGNTKELIQVMLDFNAEALSCTPSYLDKIAAVAKESYGLTPDQLGIKLILAGGEAGVDNPEFRSRIEKQWNAVLINANYGSADSVSMFASEDYYLKNGLTFLGGMEVTANLLVDGQVVEPKLGAVGELLITTNWEYGLVDRKLYRIGDVIEVTEILDRNKFRFKIIGRADDMLVIRGLNVYPSTINDVFQRTLNEYGLSGKFQLHVSKESPIEKVKLITDVTDESFLEDLGRAIKESTSISVFIYSGVVVEGSTGKTKMVVKDL